MISLAQALNTGSYKTPAFNTFRSPFYNSDSTLYSYVDALPTNLVVSADEIDEYITTFKEEGGNPQGHTIYSVLSGMEWPPLPQIEALSGRNIAVDDFIDYIRSTPVV